MKKLDKLSKAQEASLAIFRDSAINFALYGGDEVDVEKFHKGIDFVYSLAKSDAPIKVYVDSPLGVQYACQMIKAMPLKSRDQVGAQVGDQVGAQVGDQVGDQVWAQVGAQVGDQVWDQVWAQVGDQVWAQVGAQVGAQVWDQVREYYAPAYCGSGYDAGWVSFYRVFTEFGILKHDLFNQYSDFVDSGIWDAVMFRGCAIGCRRPNKVCRDDQTRLHNDNGSAISWRDGFELYYLDGVHLKKEIWEQIVSQTMSFDEILKIEDSDIRAVALKYNKNAIIASGAELIDEHPTAGELFLVQGKEINKILDAKKMYFLRMPCPTGRTFVEAVDPAFAEKHPYSLHCQANAWGISPKIYEQVVNHG